MKSLLLLLLASVHACAVEIIAHRGYSAEAPENTIAAFALAWQHGADACELDLHMTADEQIVVIHDRDTKRTVPGENKVIEKTTLADLPTLPTLLQALETMPKDRGRFFLEIKCGPEILPILMRQLEPWKPRAHQLVIISFNRSVTSLAKQSMPWLKVMQLASGKDENKQPRGDLEKVIAQAKSDHLDGLNLSGDWQWDAGMVKQIRDAQLGVFVWTINQPERARVLADLGVDGITTDDPVLIREALK